MTPFRDTLAKVAAGQTLTRDEMRSAFDLIFDGAVSEIEIAGLLMGLRARGETAEEIVAAAEAMRARAVRVAAPSNAIDTCGTGGDGAHTFNISTAAALIAAGAGATVAKHGNRAASSKSGSSDVLAALGVNLDATTAQVEDCIAQAGVGFMFAAKHHQAVARVAPVRKALGVRTIFNLLGPLSNPAGAKKQVLGVFDKSYVEPLAIALRDLGSTHAWVIHGQDGLDELTTTTSSLVAELKDGRVTIFDVSPEDANLPRADASKLKGGDAHHNAEALRRLLDGEKTAYRDIAILNAAAALIVAGIAKDLKQGASLAADSIDSGKAKRALAELVRLSGGAA